MDEERRQQAPPTDEETPDYTHEMEMLDEFRGLMRRSGLGLGAAVALGGWYLSRALGRWFLIGGIALGALIGGGFLIGGALGGKLLGKRIGSGREEENPEKEE